MAALVVTPAHESQTSPSSPGPERTTETSALQESQTKRGVSMEILSVGGFIRYALGDSHGPYLVSSDPFAAGGHRSRLQHKRNSLTAPRKVRAVEDG